MNRLLRGRRLPFSADLFLSFPEALLLNSFVSLKKESVHLCVHIFPPATSLPASLLLIVGSAS